MFNNHILVSGSNHGLQTTQLVFATSPLIWILVQVHRVKPTEDGGSPFYGMVSCYNAESLTVNNSV